MSEHLSQMNGLHLFYHPLSNNACRVLLLCYEKNLPINKHFINLLKSEQLTEQYLAINPKCEVPALVHDGQSITESVAIMRYLEQQFPETSFIPEQASLQQQVNDWLEQAAAFHMPGIVNYVYSHGLGRLPTPKDWEFYQKHIPHRSQFHQDRRQGLVANDPQQAEQILDKKFAQLERVLQEQQWLVGDSYSLADIAWFADVFVINILGYSLKPYPNIRAWLQRIQQRPAFKQGYRNELPKLPLCLLGPVARLAARIVRKTGNRS